MVLTGDAGTQKPVRCDRFFYVRNLGGRATCRAHQTACFPPPCLNDMQCYTFLCFE